MFSNAVMIKKISLNVIPLQWNCPFPNFNPGFHFLLQIFTPTNIITTVLVILFWDFLIFYRVRFKNLWFAFHDSSWSFHELYFSKKISQKVLNEHKIMVLKPIDKYQIFRHCHNFRNIQIDQLQQLQNT